MATARMLVDAVMKKNMSSRNVDAAGAEDTAGLAATFVSDERGGMSLILS